VLVGSLLASGCGATVGGPLATRLSPAPAGVVLTPPSPDGVYWLEIASAVMAPNDPGGQPWDGPADPPDAYAVIYADGEQVVRTEVAADTVTPRWQGASGNFALGSASELELVVMESDTVGARQMMRVGFSPPGVAELAAGELVVEGAGGKVVLRVARAHALIGLGFDYVARDGVLQVGAVWAYSPAARAGLATGDEILRIGKREIEKMKVREIRSAINALGSSGVEVVVRHGRGGTENIVLATGPVYPLFAEYGRLD
jgi:hypothetical protein